MTELSSDYLFVAAIDFGTTYSGYAFSSRDDFISNPLKIVANQAWNAGSLRHISLKTPTCLLLDEKENIVSFGYEAENDYADVVLERKQNEFFFFQRFKMLLYKSEDIKGEMVMEDVNGKTLTAMKVFAKSIEALMIDLFKLFDQRGIEIEKNEIRWVLTVPAIWTDAAKQFMRKSANLAGIQNDQLLIALEPEAASIFCQYLHIEKLRGAEKGFCVTEDGTKYMVADIGGGTVDITVHQKISKDKLKEICIASGGDCGGTSVDNSFYQIFVKVVGAPLLKLLKQEDPSAYLFIFREFEVVKRIIHKCKKEKVTMTIPRAILDDICMTHLHENFESVVQSSPYNDQMELRYDKLRISKDLIHNLLAQASEKIIQLIKDVAFDEQSNSVGLLLLVGGFSECIVIQDEIKAKFPGKRVIVPEEAGLAVLKGAVLFGHKPEYIVSRIVKYTYGIAEMTTFKPGVHDKHHMIKVDGIEKCDNLFCIYVKKGSVVQLGEKNKRGHSTSSQYQKEVSFSVFQSSKQCPIYTDENECKLLGKLVFNVPVPTKEKQAFSCVMILGYTELKYIVHHDQTGKECKTVLDLI